MLPPLTPGLLPEELTYDKSGAIHDMSDNGGAQERCYMRYRHIDMAMDIRCYAT